MTAHLPASPDDPRALLATTRALTRTTRRDQGAGWFALLVFGVVTLLATPFLRYGPHFRHCAARGAVVQVCSVYPTLALWYWPIALVVGYVAVAWFYLRRANQRGVGTRVQPYIYVGVLLGILTALWAVWALAHPAFFADTLRLGSARSSNVLLRVTSPAGAVGLALLVLAWIERTWLLGAVALVYLAIVAAGVNTGRAASRSPWVFLPHLLLVGSILLVGAGILALVRQKPQRPAA